MIGGPNDPDACDWQDYEPPCTCVQIDVDLVDASFCEFHGDSQWNRDQRAKERVYGPDRNWPQAKASTGEEDCPF